MQTTTTTKPMTDAQRVRAYMAAAKMQVTELTGISEMQYCEWQFEAGMLYLESMCRHNAEDVRRISQDATYWGMWKVQWYRRDKEFVRQHTMCPVKMLNSGPVPKQMLLNAWVAGHRPDVLLRGVTRAGLMLEDAYNAEVVPVINRKFL